MNRHTDTTEAPASTAHDDAGRRILDAAIACLAADPRATMREVAVASGVGRATLYRYFSTREELVRAIRLRALRDCREAIDPGRLAEMTARAAITAVLAALLPVLDRYRVLLDAPPPDRADAEQRELVDAIEGPLLDIVHRGQAAGEVSGDLPPGFALDVVKGALKAARMAIAAGDLAAEDAQALAARVILAGLAPPRRRRAHPT